MCKVYVVDECFVFVYEQRDSPRSSYSRTPLIRKLVIRNANCPNGIDSSGKFVENSTKLTCLEVTGYRIEYSTVLLPLGLQIRRGRKVQTPVHTVQSRSRTSKCQCRIFANKNPVIRGFCLSGGIAVPINPDKWSYTVCTVQ